MKYLNLWQLLVAAHVWWLKREFAHQLQCLETYLESSAFDLDVSAFTYRKRCGQLRGRIKDTSDKLLSHGVDVRGAKAELKWQ